MNTDTNLKTLEGDEVKIIFSSKPCSTEYSERAWWAVSVGRNPDIEIAGPCGTREELEKELEIQRLRGILARRNRQIRGLRKAIRNQ
jgi:hypothetical protein